MNVNRKQVEALLEIARAAHAAQDAIARGIASHVEHLARLLADPAMQFVDREVLVSFERTEVDLVAAAEYPAAMAQLFGLRTDQIGHESLGTDIASFIDTAHPLPAGGPVLAAKNGIEVVHFAPVVDDGR